MIANSSLVCISSAGFVEHTFAKSVHKCAQYAHRVLNNVPCAYCAHHFLASTHFVHTFQLPGNTLCVLLQGPEILCAYCCRALTHFVHTLDTLCSYLWVPPAPLSTLFSPRSTLHAHRMPTFSDFCPLCAHFFGSRSPRNPGAPGPCIPACRPRLSLQESVKSSSNRMMIHSESAPAWGIAPACRRARAEGASGRRASNISARSLGSAKKRFLSA